MLRSLLSAFLVFAAALLVVGFTLSSSTGRRAELRFTNGNEPKTLDPQLATGQPEHRILTAIFEGLARLDARSLEPAPGAAESWDISPDGKTYTFHLRPNARWSDGHPLTAQDFCYSWRRLQEPSLGSEYAYIMHMVRYAQAYNTHADQAQALRGPIRTAVAALLQKYPAAIPAAELLAFSQKQNLEATLKGTENVLLRNFLLRAPGDLPHAELAALPAELEREAERRGALYEEAKRHFGVDGGVYAKDDYTLVVELNAPTPYFLELTSFYPLFPVPRWAIEHSAGRNWFLPDRIVSNGPFRLRDWRVGDHMRLERDPSYWGHDQVKLRDVDVLPIENTTTTLNLYLTGEVDWLPLEGIPQELAPELRGRPDFFSGPAFISYYYRINCTRKPFDDVRVRKALNLAIDREQITRDVLRMGQRPGTYFVPPGVRGYQSPESGISFDVAQAQKLLAEAGFPDGRGFPKFGILYNTLELHKKVAEVVADQLRRNLHVDAAAYNQEWQSYLQSTRSMDYDLARAGWVGDYEDPNTFLDLWLTNGGNNRSGWGSPVYDRLLAAAGDVERFVTEPEFVLEHAHDAPALKRMIDAASSTTDAARRLKSMAELRLALLAEAERILIHDEFPILPVYVYVTMDMAKPAVKGLYTTLVGSDGAKRPNLRDIHPLRDIWIQRSAESERP
ncbi:MAG TPA: peptide ABC transporter substrate-binding protein [Polyangiaceae bacterium]|nr:peptide ABC transporter substrate-binding protein [Polyangiaceae bacterium]